MSQNQQVFVQIEPQMQALRNVGKTENTILIQNLDQFVTETMLYQKFKEVGDLAFFKLKVERGTGESKGQAIVEFRDQKNVEEAINRFNGTTFFDVTVDQNQRKMYVMKKLDKETMSELKQSAQLFFKYEHHGEDQGKLDERRFRDFMSKFGEIQSCKFRQHKGTPLFYGQLIFRHVLDKQNFLNNPQNRNIVIDQFTFSFSEYNNKKEQIFSIFLKDFKNQTPLKENYSPEDKNKMLEQVRDFILSQIENEQVKKNCEVFINFDEKHALPTAFINVKSEEIAEDLFDKFVDTVTYVKIIYPKGTDRNLNKTLLIHDLLYLYKKQIPKDQKVDQDKNQSQQTNQLPDQAEDKFPSLEVQAQNQEQKNKSDGNKIQENQSKQNSQTEGQQKKQVSDQAEGKQTKPDVQAQNQEQKNKSDGNKTQENQSKQNSQTQDQQKDQENGTTTIPTQQLVDTQDQSKVEQQVGQEVQGNPSKVGVKENSAQDEDLKINSKELEDQINKALQKDITEAILSLKDKDEQPIYKGIQVFVFAVNVEKSSQQGENSSIPSNASSQQNLDQQFQQQQQRPGQEKAQFKKLWPQVRQGHILFAKKADAQKFLTQYHTKQYQVALKEFFLDKNPKFNINISKSMRQQLKAGHKKGLLQHNNQVEADEKVLANTHMNHQYQIQNYQQMTNQPQIQMQNNYPNTNPNRIFQPNRPAQYYVNNNQFPNSNSQNYNSPNRQPQSNYPSRPYNGYNPRGPINNSGQYNPNPNRPQNQNNQPRNIAGTNFPPIQAQTPTQIKQPSNNTQNQPSNSGNRTNTTTQQQQQQQVQNQFNALNEIKNKREAFVQLQVEEQKLILGRLIYPKVQIHLNQTNQTQTEVTQITPKITGMLIDFSVFEIDDIIDMLENEEEFKERIEEAIGLIKSQNQN